MNNKKLSRAFTLILSAAIGAWAPGAMANLILAQDANVSIVSGPTPLNTTPVADATVNPVSTINVGGGQIQLHDYNNAPLVADFDAVTPGNQAPSWWDVPGTVPYTTTTAGIVIDFVNLSVTGFTFNIGASQSGSAWIRAYYDDANGAEQTVTTNWFSGIADGTSPSYGVYAAAGSCARITRVEIDPPLVWGVGNFGLAQSAQCASVPEPGTATLLGLGLMAAGLGRFAARRRKALA